MELKTFSNLKKLYYKSFPPQERISLWLLMVNSWRRLGRWHLYQEKGNLIAFAYTVETAELYFILLLAVAPEHQSQGYGSLILQELIQTAGLKSVLITIEPMDQQSENYSQRLKRLAFYEKNSFELTNHYYHEGEETYQIITKNSKTELEKFEKIMQRFFGKSLKIKVD